MIFENIIHVKMKLFRKKTGIFGIFAILILILCYIFGRYIVSSMHFDEKKDQDGHQLNVAQTEIWENIRYEGNKDVADNPWNMTVGQFDMEGEGTCILLTPNTSLQIDNKEKRYNTFEFMYQIHPWIKQSSDGAGLLVQVLNDNDNILYEEVVAVEVDDDWEKYKINLDQYSETIKVFCNNGVNGDDRGDWVVVKPIGALRSSDNLSTRGYVKSATYFAQEWPVNFWNSEMDTLESDMAQIKEDGFNSIILVIPWREFQPDIDPIRYNENALATLDKVMVAAGKEGLDVYVRIGYTWDYYNDVNENIVDRFCRLLFDEQAKNAWFAYVAKIYSELNQYDNFAEGFLTWEDFWNNLGICDELEESSRLERAHQIGYGKWVEQFYSLEEYNNRYGTKYNSYDQIVVPRRDEPAMYAMFEYYDCFLIFLLNESQKRFPNLSMEVRLDWDVTYNSKGKVEYYKHTDTFPCGESSFTSAMYGIPMGFKNVGERVSYKEGLKKTEYVLSQLQQQNKNKPIYVEQFIFADNTPAFRNNAQIRDDEIDDYLEAVSEVLLNCTSGYGIWTYRNYQANMIYNSQFAWNNEGWKCEGDVQFIRHEGSMVCELGDNATIFQEIPPIRNHFDSDIYKMSLSVKDIMQTGALKITVGSVSQTVNVEDDKIIELIINKSEGFDLSIESLGCSVRIDDLKLYSQIQEGFLYDESGNESACIESIRILNMQLEK